MKRPAESVARRWARKRGLNSTFASSSTSRRITSLRLSLGLRIAVSRSATAASTLIKRWPPGRPSARSRRSALIVAAIASKAAGVMEIRIKLWNSWRAPLSALTRPAPMRQRAEGKGKGYAGSATPRSSFSPFAPTASRTSSGRGLCSASASTVSASSHRSTSAGVARMTGIAFG